MKPDLWRWWANHPLRSEPSYMRKAFPNQKNTIIREIDRACIDAAIFRHMLLSRNGGLAVRKPGPWENNIMKIMLNNDCFFEYIFATKAELADMEAKKQGFCTRCAKVVNGVSPKAVENKCRTCKKPMVYGIVGLKEAGGMVVVAAEG